MWLDEADSFAEIFKGYLPFYLLVAVPLLLIVAPAYPVAASHEFSVYRMQQYDLHNVPHGKSPQLNCFSFIKRNRSVVVLRLVFSSLVSRLLMFTLLPSYQIKMSKYR